MNRRRPPLPTHALALLGAGLFVAAPAVVAADGVVATGITFPKVDERGRTAYTLRAERGVYGKTSAELEAIRVDFHDAASTGAEGGGAAPAAVTAVLTAPAGTYDNETGVLRGDGRVRLTSPEMSVEGVGYTLDSEEKLLRLHSAVVATVQKRAVIDERLLRGELLRDVVVDLDGDLTLTSRTLDYDYAAHAAVLRGDPRAEDDRFALASEVMTFRFEVGEAGLDPAGGAGADRSHGAHTTHEANEGPPPDEATAPPPPPAASPAPKKPPVRLLELVADKDVVITNKEPDDERFRRCTAGRARYSAQEEVLALTGGVTVHRGGGKGPVFTNEARYRFGE